MIVIGLMSGTSGDGTDAATVHLEGEPPGLRWQVLSHVHVPHPPGLRGEIFAGFRPETCSAERLCLLNFSLGRAFGQAALKAIEAAGLRPEQVDLIGSHGQTLWHAPGGPEPSTLQLGETAVIAEMTGVTTVGNFRTRDMAAGGQGAPLVAYVDTLMLTHSTLTRAAQNIGGIANLTYLPPLQGGSGQALAFDTGPGNMLIDYAAGRATAGQWICDRDGQLAAQGRVDDRLLAELLAEPYLRRHPPKTTGRELFGAQRGAQVWDAAKARGLSDHDIVATVTAFTARSIAAAYHDFLPSLPDEVIVSGGGARNPVLMEMLRQALAPARVMLSDEVGLSVEAKEAVAFAVLAYESWNNRPGNLPAATGARKPVVLGHITPGASFKRPSSHFKAPAFVAASDQLTESRNLATKNIDRVSTLDMVRLINDQDMQVARAVNAQLPAIAQAIDEIAGRMRTGGRLIYIGAGTSGRLGVLDAAECPPTFNTSPDQVIAVIAGGNRAITLPVEGAEDDAEAGARAIAALDVSERDSVVGIAASGRTPYVLGGMREARQRGAFVASLACNHPSPVEELADVPIAPVVGPEVIAGSTRLKAGTAQKMVLNMISTAVMIRLGKTFGNLMVDVQATNSKLQARARQIVQEASGLSPEAAASLLQICGGEVKTAIVSMLASVPPEEARRRLEAAGGVVRLALGDNHDR